MAYNLVPSGRFKKRLKKIDRDPVKKQAVAKILNDLAKSGHKALAKKHRPHKLKGGYKGHWECHALPDLLIIWKQLEKPDKSILLVEVGSHSGLF